MRCFVRTISWKNGKLIGGFLTGFRSADGGESMSDVCGIVDGQSGGQNDDDGRRNLDSQTPKVHQTEQVDQRESDAGKNPKDGHQIRDENQRHADNSCHGQS